jgi:predicted neuraminidase
MKKGYLFMILLIVSTILQAQNLYKGDGCIQKSEFIYQPGDVRFPSCHASTIAQSDGGFIASWFGGTEEKNPDVGIWISRYSDGKWSKPEEAANGVRQDKRYPCWNPVLYYSGNEILLFYKVGSSPSTWRGELITSDDNGLSWSASKKLPEGIIGPVKNKPVLLSNGILLCPSSTEDQGWRIHMDMTPDNGVSWKRTEALNDRSISAIQPSVLMHPQGKLQSVCRTRQGKIFTSWSEDNGAHWTILKPLELPNPNSGIDAVTLKDGRHMIVYNHLATGRYMLNVAISDDGITWEAAALLENDKKEAEYSYPAVIQSSDGMVHITYTWNRKLIRHIIIDPSLIIPFRFENGDWPTVK